MGTRPDVNRLEVIRSRLAEFDRPAAVMLP